MSNQHLETPIVSKWKQKIIYWFGHLSFLKIFDLQYKMTSKLTISCCKRLETASFMASSSSALSASVNKINNVYYQFATSGSISWVSFIIHYWKKTIFINYVTYWKLWCPIWNPLWRVRWEATSCIKLHVHIVKRAMSVQQPDIYDVASRNTNPGKDAQSSSI